MTMLCSSSAVDKDSNSLSLFNMIEEITVDFKTENNQPINFTQKKGVPIPFELVSIWNRPDDSPEVSTEIKMVLHDPDGEIMQESVSPLEIKNPHHRMRIRVKGNGLNVTKQGKYYFSILFKNDGSFDEVVRVPLTVKVSTPIPSDLRILKK